MNKQLAAVSTRLPLGTHSRSSSIEKSTSLPWSTISRKLNPLSNVVCVSEHTASVHEREISPEVTVGVLARLFTCNSRERDLRGWERSDSDYIAINLPFGKTQPWPHNTQRCLAGAKPPLTHLLDRARPLR